MKLFQMASISYCINQELLPKIIVNTPSNSLRKTFGLPFCEHTSQLNQDVFALISNKFKSGYFLEIGANDGFTLSNTVYLEECFNWSGILVEPNPAFLPSLKKRKAKLSCKAVANIDGVIEFIDAGLFGGIASTIDSSYKRDTSEAPIIEVEATSLEKILKEHSAPSVIDYISIDVEGGEIAILEQMCALKDYRFSCGSIEHNHRKNGVKNYKQLLESANYQIVWADQTSFDLFFIDKLKCS